jgi:hypothetical protein
MGTHTWIIGFVLPLLFASCTSSDEQKGAGKSGEAPVAEKTLKTLDSAGSPSATQIEEKEKKLASLSQGTITALGLSIPKGMTPATGVPKVFRFEGRHPLNQVKNFIEKQVYLQEPSQKHGKGFLLRKAKVISPKGKSKGDKLLAVRIFRGRKTGAMIDIWLESDFASKHPGKAQTHTQKSTTVTRKSRQKKSGPRKPIGNFKSKSLQNLMTVMSKVQNGEELTEAEKNSSFFY